MLRLRKELHNQCIDTRGESRPVTELSAVNPSFFDDHLDSLVQSRSDGDDVGMNSLPPFSDCHPGVELIRHNDVAALRARDDLLPDFQQDGPHPIEQNQVRGGILHHLPHVRQQLPHLHRIVRFPEIQHPMHRHKQIGLVDIPPANRLGRDQLRG